MPPHEIELHVIGLLLSNDGSISAHNQMGRQKNRYGLAENVNVFHLALT
jgi:hypothetical protein